MALGWATRDGRGLVGASHALQAPCLYIFIFIFILCPRLFPCDGHTVIIIAGVMLGLYGVGGMTGAGRRFGQGVNLSQAIHVNRNVSFCFMIVRQGVHPVITPVYKPIFHAV
jgi:hypothetical protein